MIFYFSIFCISNKVFHTLSSKRSLFLCDKLWFLHIFVIKRCIRFGYNYIPCRSINRHISICETSFVSCKRFFNLISLKHLHIKLNPSWLVFHSFLINLFQCLITHIMCVYVICRYIIFPLNILSLNIKRC